MARTVATWGTTIALLTTSRHAEAASPGVSPTAAEVVLLVGVHRSAGAPGAIAADGAAGLCAVVAESVRCPAAGPVTFRWAGDEAFVLTDGQVEGRITLEPGTSREAWVLAPEAARLAERARLAPGVVTAADVDDLFVRTGDHPVSVPSHGMLTDLVALADHPDPLVRRKLPDALLPWWRHTWSDPLPVGAPPVLPAGLLVRLADDPDMPVRRRLASRLRDLREPGEVAAREATEVLLSLAAERGGVQKAALSSLASRTREDATPADITWRTAMERLQTPGPPGRAAAGVLAALAGRIEPGPGVDPIEAVHRCLAAHPERTWSLWNAWREHVPFDMDRAGRLVRSTIGWSPSLLKSWATTDPAGLYALLHGWEPGAPHTDRWEAMVRALGQVEDPDLAALTDSLSPAEEGGGPR